jgi:thiamine kinase-like enzyme
MARSIVVARHLEAALVPALRVSGAIDPGPHPSAAHFVTFWEHVDHDASRPVDPIRAGDRLRELHETLASLPREGFPRLGPFTELPPMIDALVGSRAFSEREGALLSSRLEASLADIETLGLPETVLHGDASPGNLLHTPDGPIWSDFEEACVGPRELDLACIVATARAFDLPSRPLREAILVASGPHDEVVLRPFSDARVIQSLVWEAAMSTGDEAARAAASARRAAWERSLK